MSEKTIFEILTDENDVENIVMSDDEGNDVEFEQIATVPLDDQLYCILRPLGIEDFPEDAALVFLFGDDDENETLSVVEDDDICDKVFEEYYKLCEE